MPPPILFRYTLIHTMELLLYAFIRTFLCWYCLRYRYLAPSIQNRHTQRTIFDSFFSSLFSHSIFLCLCVASIYITIFFIFWIFPFLAHFHCSVTCFFLLSILRMCVYVFIIFSLIQREQPRSMWLVIIIITWLFEKFSSPFFPFASRWPFLSLFLTWFEFFCSLTTLIHIISTSVVRWCAFFVLAIFNVISLVVAFHEGYMNRAHSLELNRNVISKKRK